MDKTVYTIARTKSGTDHLSGEDGIMCGADLDHYGNQVFLREFSGCQKCREIAKGTYSRESKEDQSDSDETLLDRLMGMDRIEELEIGKFTIKRESRHKAPDQWDVTYRKSEGHLKGYKSRDPYRVIDWIESHSDMEVRG